MRPILLLLQQMSPRFKVYLVLEYPFHYPLVQSLVSQIRAMARPSTSSPPTSCRCIPISFPLLVTCFDHCRRMRVILFFSLFKINVDKILNNQASDLYQCLWSLLVISTALVRKQPQSSIFKQII